MMPLPMSEAFSRQTDAVTSVLRASITINRGLLPRADISADNGFMHLIDKVLIPPFPNSSHI
ncbi:MAG TPA: hypothetical protein VE843_09470 [Ktedonobacteraceae bacterium]|nr:hypothetical protein [Ktedonobacteraceae bacterium]